ncbi:MAG: hypothetical protein LUE26_07675 [Alistipes sp.]|nr:hypothetical protein [Alistipes sp.]
MKYLKYTLFLLALAMASGGCNRDTADYTVPGEDGTAKLRLKVTTPGTRGATRAVAEEEVSEINVLVFRYTGSEYVLSYIVPGYAITATTGTYDYEFQARILTSDEPLRLWLLANAGSAVDAAGAGMTEEEVKQAVTMAYGAAGFSDVLPMTGSVDFDDGITADEEVDAVLLRSAARVDVVNQADNFTLTSVRVYRANDLVQVIPDAVSGNAVTAASVPGGAEQDVDTDTFTVTGGSLTAQIYIPESAIPDAADRRLGATAVVVGGQYDGSTETTYYRMDFIPDDGGSPDEALFGQVLRNHLYRFVIQEVQAPGWPTDDDASVNPSTGIDVEIEVWDEETLDMVFDDYDYFGVSGRTVRLGYPAGSTGYISVDTSLDSYEAWWGDADGNIDPNAGPITPGGNLDDPGSLYNAAISADGSRVAFTTLAAYDESTAEAAYLVLVAGRMRIVVTVTQAPADYGDRNLIIANSTYGIGTWGDYRLGVDNPITVAGERSRGLVNMLLRDTNFGPQGTVRLESIFISGVGVTATMPPVAYRVADVLYLTYDTNPQQSDVDSILDWLAEDDHRMLVVQFDNAATNNNMMTTLGFKTRNFSGATTAYTYAGTAAPDFVKYGPFGTVDAAFSYKCRDDTYGVVAPSEADALGYIPILTGNGTTTTTGYYLMAVNPERRVIICGDCDVYSNNADGSSGYYLNLTATSYTIDPANPAHVMMGNLWAWIIDVALGPD